MVRQGKDNNVITEFENEKTNTVLKNRRPEGAGMNMNHVGINHRWPSILP